MAKTDIEIAQETELEPIVNVARKIGIDDEFLDYHGKYVAKVSINMMDKLKRKDGKLILVTAITPTKAGEGKTTTTVGLGQAFKHIDKKAIICIREPSLGPCFGIKGGAAGGGFSQVLPMEDINLHFIGDIHAVGAANNLLAAIIDNHLVRENELNIDPNMVVWKRAIDMNDRTLRNIFVGCDEKKVCLRSDAFDITVASEVMAVLCLSKDLEDLKKRLSEMIVAYTFDKKPVRVKDLHVQGAMAALLKHAVNPNLVQTIEKTPAFVHGGPFANIAHGCSSLIATKMALKLADYVITEAGFGADLGAEKFFNIKCRIGDLKPDAVVLVATIRALEMHGGSGGVEAVRKGLSNLEKQIENVQKFNVPLVVCLNKFSDDSDEEIGVVLNRCKELNVDAAVSDVWGKGGEGGVELAEKVIELADKESDFRLLYDGEVSIKDKIETIAKEIYGADGVEYADNADNDIRLLEKEGFSKLPICVAKTQNSLSDDPNLLGRPKGFKIKVKQARVSAGAGFIVVLTGDVMTMPGLPKKPAAELVDIDKHGRISGLF